MKKIVYILTCLLPVSCSPRVLPPAERTDSVKVVIRDRIVHDTAYFTIEKEVEKVATKDTSSHLENTYAKSDASVRDGLLHHSLETKPQKVTVPTTTEVHDTTYIEKEAVKEYVEVNRLTAGQAAWIKTGKVLLGICIGLVLLLALKIYIKIRFKR